MQQFDRVLDRILPRVQKPARYTGGEFNSITKDWSGLALKIALGYPDLYEVGMSNLGLGIIYHLVNSRPDWVAERVYTPWPDMEAEMRKAGIPLFSIETRRPIADFDMMCLSLAYEQTYTNVLTMLDLAGMPLRWADRGDEHPIVLAGGPSAVNPEPMSSFIDIFVVGEAEEAFPEVLQLYQDWRDGGGTVREEFLHRAMSIRGVYVPRFYAATYKPDGTLERIAPTNAAAPPKVRRAIVKDLPPLPTKPIIPFIETVHDRVAIEVMRGCTRGCRFCQPGMATRPVRERSTDEILQTADDLLRNTGYDEISLVSLSTADHSTIDDVAQKMAKKYDGQRITISLSSLRVDSFSVALADAVAKGKRAGLTFAPEAGTQRLRDAINKPVTDEDLMRSVEHAYKRGWNSVKLYFMIGLPTETHEDIHGIVDLVRKVRDVGQRHRGFRAKVRVTISTFVPKPHTPFQWAAQDSDEQLKEKLDILFKGLRGNGIHLSWHDSAESQIESALSRGDRRFGDVIERAWQLGARFDAWDDKSKYDRWTQAAIELGMTLEFYANRKRPIDEVLPWSHIDSGAAEAFLRWDYRRSLRTETTPDCHFDTCSGCGLHKTFEPCTQMFNATVVERQAVRQAAVAAGRGRG